MDFTLTTYQKLLTTLKSKGYAFQPFADAIENPRPKTIILRHDVDRLPKNAIKTAKMEHELGIQSSYYFRAQPGIFKPEITKQIADLGHEIGYHYEDLSITNGDIDKAYESFRKNLEAFRKIYPVKTICMHGSPRSKWDSREIWNKYNYKKLVIIGEPYFDVDYSKVLYITDTGRKWNNAAVSVRDKVEVGEQRSEVRGQKSEACPVKCEFTNIFHWGRKAEVREQRSEIRGQRSEVGGQVGGKNLQEFYHFKNTQDIIKATENNELPSQIMFNIHPHRWHDNFWGWTKELVMQNAKNVVKRMIVNYRR